MPFQLDTRIPLSSQAPPARSPLQAIGVLGQLQAQAELGEQRRLMNEQRQRALEDDEAIRSTLPRHPRPDDAIEDLYRQGRPSAAAALSKNVFEYRKSQADALKTDLDNRKAKFKMASQILRGVLIDGTENAYQSALPAVRSLVGDDLASQLGSQYDKKTIEGALAWGDEYDSYLDGQLKATKAASEAMDLQHKPEVDAIARAKNQEDAYTHWMKAASNSLGVVKNQQQLDTVRAALIGAGAPPAIFDQFGDYDAGFNERARKLGMTAAEEGQEANSAAIREQAKATAGETKRYHDAMIEERRRDREQRAAGAGTPGGRGITPTAVSELKVRKHRAYEEAEKAYKEAVDPLLSQTDAKSGQRRTATPEDQAQYEALTREHAQRKLQIEDTFRDEMGLPPILATEYQLRSDKSKATDLRKIRNEYKMLTGEETPLEQLTKINAQLAREKDPTKRQQLVQQGEALINRYAAYR